jgi:putative tricarboxylic transport membrane protein
MRQHARSLCSLTLLCLLLAAVCVGPAGAQERAPKFPVEITVGSGAGATPDVMMRRVVKIWGEEKIVTQPVVVVNRPGGSWTVGVNWVLGKRGADNLLMTIAQPVLTTPIVQGQKNTFDQLVPIAMFVQADLMVLVQPKSAYNSMADFVNAAKKAPRSVKVSGSQTGGTDQMVASLIERAGGVKLNYIPYESGSAATAAFLGGNVDAVPVTLDEGLPLIQAGKARALAVITEKRRTEPELKDFPTAKEQGFDVVFGQFWGLAGPPGMEPALVKWWDDKLQKLVQTKAWKDALTTNFLRSEYHDSTKSPAFLKARYEEYLSLLRELGLAKQ